MKKNEADPDIQASFYQDNSNIPFIGGIAQYKLPKRQSNAVE